MKLLVVATHPIQYQAPWFRALAASLRLDLVVAYAHLPDPQEQGAGFGIPFSWDVPLLDGYRWVRLELESNRPGRFLGLRARRLDALLVRERPDAVLVLGWNSWVLVQALLAARRLGIPTIVRGDSNDLRSRPRMVRLLQRSLLSRFDVALAVGRANRSFLEARGVPAARIVDAPHFVDNDAFARAAAAQEKDRASLRTAWGVPANRCCGLFVGKLIRKKRPHDLLDALGARDDLRRDAWLLVVGEGELRPELEERVAREELPVTFAGFLNQSAIPRAYVAADVLVLPSDAGETWGLVVNEAMACGLPAIVSDLAGCSADLIRGDETGWCYPCGDVGRLADALVAANGDRARTRERGLAAQRLVSAEHTIERSVEATVVATEMAVQLGRR